MTLSSSLNNALSGLTAASRAAEVVSSNVANAMTEGYARREVRLSSQSVDGSGAGVRVDGIERMANERTIADRRLAAAAVADSGARAAAWLRLEEAIGLPTESGSLTDRVNAFEAALQHAASRPDEQTRLDQVAGAAAALTGRINEVSREIQSMRMDADHDIGAMVNQLNTNLKRVEEVNFQVALLQDQGRDASSLLDERQRLVDSIAEIVPVQQVARDRGQIALYSAGGAILLDGTAATFGFEPAGIITPYMSLDAGDLAGLSLNGNPLNVGGRYDPIAGGKLSAAFAARDSIAPEAQAGLDAVARDLIERFQDPGLDPSIPAGGAGIFADGGAAFDPADELGLAERISLNPAIDPSQGGESRRLRDGLGTLVAGPAGDATLLNALAERIGAQRVPASGLSSGLPRSAAGVASDLLSRVSANQLAAGSDEAFHLARHGAIATKEAEDGVNTDDELQKLLLIEEAYAANARVMQAIDAMIQQLMEI